MVNDREETMRKILLFAALFTAFLLNGEESAKLPPSYFNEKAPLVKLLLSNAPIKEKTAAVESLIERYDRLFGVTNELLDLMRDFPVHREVLAKVFSPEKRKALQKECKKGDPYACYRYGMTLAEGFGGPVDRTNAEKVLQGSCDKGSALGCDALGRLLRTAGSQDIVSIEDSFKKACKGGSAGGCYHLAEVYRTATPVHDGLIAAANYFQKSCNSGYTLGCHYAAELFEKGAGYAVDPELIPKDYKKGCAGGYAPSCAAIARTETGYRKECCALGNAACCAGH